MGRPVIVCVGRVRSVALAASLTVVGGNGPEGIRQKSAHLVGEDQRRVDIWPHSADVAETGLSQIGPRTVGMAFIARRILASIPVVIGVTIVAFLLIHMVPGNPAQQMLFGSDATAQQINALSRQLGLTEPLWRQ